MINIGLFGFGRIGRSIARQIINSKDFELSFICDENPSLENISYLLKYDSTYGRFEFDLQNFQNYILINKIDKKIFYYEAAQFNLINYSNVDLIIDATGSKDLAISLEKIIHQYELRLIQTNSSDPNSEKVIFGINETNILNRNLNKICSSTCDANGCGSIIKAISQFYEFEFGNISILHPWSNYQNLIDGPSMMYSEKNKIFNNYSLGRSAQDNLIPRNTSCIDALKDVLPSTKGKLQGMCVRVPTAIVCGAVVTLKMKSFIYKEELHKNLLDSDLAKRDLLIVETEQLVSKDFLGTNKNVHLDSRWTEISDQNYLRFFIWYDNEWGYSSNVLRLANYWIKNI